MAKEIQGKTLYFHSKIMSKLPCETYKYLSMYCSLHYMYRYTNTCMCNGACICIEIRICVCI